MNNLSTLAEQIVQIAQDAGSAILEIYQKDFAIYEKQDESPLTEADLAAHKIIAAGLKEISEYPVLSEESADIDWSERQQWSTYWLVDPLDGTKEFIKKNGEFTVNIALISDGKPVLGVVYAPVLNTTYIGESGIGAFKYSEGKKEQISLSSWESGDIWKIVGSRSHQSPEIQDFLASLPGEAELVAMGSSLKLCLVAEGKAHLYPRLGPTSEWDTGAAQAVVEAAGGKVSVFTSSDKYSDELPPLRYNQKESYLNPYFLVSC